MDIYSHYLNITHRQIFRNLEEIRLINHQVYQALMSGMPLREREASIYRKRGFKGAENLALTGKAEQ
jgi:hypothetical protein